MYSLVGGLVPESSRGWGESVWLFFVVVVVVVLFCFVFCFACGFFQQDENTVRQQNVKIKLGGSLCQRPVCSI